MTPMVDIAFLLLIFYMVTTVFAMPQAMEINLPPEDSGDVEIAESNLLTIRVDGEGRFWWNLKRVSPENMPIMLPPSPDVIDTSYVFWSDTLQGLLIAQNRENNKLSTLIQIHREANYSDMVNILDEIDMIERSWNAFTAEEMGVKVDELTKGQKFSYRYAIGAWESRDDRIIEAAEKQTEEGGGQ